jgi:hypothetical protein
MLVVDGKRLSCLMMTEMEGRLGTRSETVVVSGRLRRAATPRNAGRREAQPQLMSRNLRHYLWLLDLIIYCGCSFLRATITIHTITYLTTSLLHLWTRDKPIRDPKYYK